MSFQRRSSTTTREGNEGQVFSFLHRMLTTHPNTILSHCLPSLEAGVLYYPAIKEASAKPNSIISPSTVISATKHEAASVFHSDWFDQTFSNVGVRGSRQLHVRSGKSRDRSRGGRSLSSKEEGNVDRWPQRPNRMERHVVG